MLRWLPRDAHLTEEVLEGLKGGSVLGLVGPALQHKLVNIAWAVLWLTETLPILVYLFQDLRPTHTIHLKFKPHWRFNQ